MEITRTHGLTKPGPDDWFTGAVWIDEIAAPPEPSRLHVVSVHFSPGARTAWHRHPGGQLLFVETGRARVGERGGALHELATGESHYTAPNVEHWHGATPDSEFTQVALGRGDTAETVWLEKVSDEQYAGR